MNFTEDVLERFPASAPALLAISRDGGRRVWHFGELVAMSAGLSSFGSFVTTIGRAPEKLRSPDNPCQNGWHDVQVAGDSRLGGLLGEHAPVKSHHHQGMGRIGEGLREVAWAEDGVVEGLEDPSKRFALGVLWHPEEGEDAALFQALVEEAKRYREERS